MKFCFTVYQTLRANGRCLLSSTTLLTENNSLHSRLWRLLMEIQKYQLITAHILGHAKVEKLPEKQDLSKNATRIYNVIIPQPILINLQI